MAQTISSPKVSLQMTAGVTDSLAYPLATYQVNFQPAFNVSFGTGAGQANLAYTAAFTVTNGTPLVLDINALVDAVFQTSQSFFRMLGYGVENDSLTAGQDFTVGGGSNPISPTDVNLCKANGGAILVWNPNPGYVMNSSTAHLLQITVAAGTTVPGKITIFGCSA